MTEDVIKECEFYLPLSENCNEILDSNGNEIYKCSRRQDCYYKQLKRLEQENFALTQESQQKSQTICELEQENKELKETVKDLNQSIQNCNIQRTKMYKALEEIREIAKDIIENDVYENSDIKAENILTKINEVLGNEGN